MKNRPMILNSQGKEIVLNEFEQRRADKQEEILKNDFGFEIDITSLTAIVKKVSEQKFFQIMPADYMPVRVGEGAWSDFLNTYLSYDIGGDFKKGILQMGSNNSRLAAMDTAITTIAVPVINWGKNIGWSLIELQQASKAGSWDLITAKERSRKINWDLGIQEVAFLGLSNVSGVLGLYGQSVLTDTTTLPQPIYSLAPPDLKAFCQAMLRVYRSNCNQTAWPTHFIIPEEDYLGLAGPTNPDFPIQTVLEQLRQTLAQMTMNPNFKILPCAYGNASRNGLGGSLLRYILLNYDDSSLRMDIPVDYTTTLANSNDNFAYQNVGYGQFTGVMAYRPKEMVYFDCAPI